MRTACLISALRLPRYAHAKAADTTTQRAALPETGVVVDIGNSTIATNFDRLRLIVWALMGTGCQG